MAVVAIRKHMSMTAPTPMKLLFLISISSLVKRIKVILSAVPAVRL
jgi:hypothetical protein